MISFLRNIAQSYQKVEKHILYLVAGEFFLQMVNSSFFLLFNYHMAAHGYQDYEIADVLAKRFLMVMLLALPIGFLIKRIRLKPFFLFSATMVPILSLTVIYAVSHQMDGLVNFCMYLWGAGFAIYQIAALPYILMYAKKETHSEAISLFFQTWSIAICLAGVFNYILNNLRPDIFDEGMVLSMYSVFSFIGLWFISRIKNPEVKRLTTPFNWKTLLKEYDWYLILQVIVPTFIIAIGAGFTIPVINLFFLNVHGVPSDDFSIYGATTYGLVALGMTFMPYIKRTFGYQIAITLFQSLAVLALLGMSVTEYFKGWEYAVYIAIFFYIIRQPLMNMVGPMTSELTMYYVGEKNQEMISSLNSAIWSGSWLVSMKLFAWMRLSGMRYVSIFLITVVLYTIGVIGYAVIIRKYERRES